MIRAFICALTVAAAMSAACDLPHQHTGLSFITDPGLELFGARLDRADGRIIVKSSFQSSITGRTEYIYENLDMELPGTVAAGSVIDATGKDVVIRYAKGGQGGQMETARARGSLTVLAVSECEMKLKCELEFSGFTAKGHPGDLLASISRKGTLTAKKGYRLY